jgi:hypothetical protein
MAKAARTVGWTGRAAFVLLTPLASANRPVPSSSFLSWANPEPSYHGQVEGGDKCSIGAASTSSAYDPATGGTFVLCIYSVVMCAPLSSTDSADLFTPRWPGAAKSHHGRHF